MLMLDNVIIFLFVRMFLRIKSHSNYLLWDKIINKLFNQIGSHFFVLLFYAVAGSADQD